ncbi:hypothetical protein CR513_12969, partial [Mucuna pruriens]
MDSAGDVSLSDCLSHSKAETAVVGAGSATLGAYEYSRIYKEKVKHFHDSRILRKEFKVGQKLYHEGLNLSSIMCEVEIITLTESIIPKNPPEAVPKSPYT